MKKGLPADVLLFFRLGDFYELFFEDAKEASALLGVTLTKRNSIPMCGVPHHSAESYINRLIKAGKRVAIGEQTSTPVPGKLVEREIVRIISAGTVADMHLLDAARHNYIVALLKTKQTYGLACIDHTTGDFSVAEFTRLDLLQDELARISPTELLVSDEQKEIFSSVPATLYYDAYTFIPASAMPNLLEHFKVHSLDGFGCAELEPAIGAAGAILHYLTYQLRRPVEHIRRLSLRTTEQSVLIDQASQRNLDIVDSRSGHKFSLLGILDRTSTPMGARLLREWLLHPICDIPTLNLRHDAIETFLQEPFLMSKLRAALKQVRDLQRLTSKLAQQSGNARDLQALATSLSQIPELQDLITPLQTRSALLAMAHAQLGEFDALVSRIQSLIVEEPPIAIKEGGIFQSGYNAELDTLRMASTEGKNWLAEMQEKERTRTGIDSLKIKYNSVFGYYIEITKSNYDKVPADYTRKQTLANAERFITPELKQMENTILGADERSRQLEYTEFVTLRQEVASHVEHIQQTASAVASIDVILALAEVAQQYRYTRPTLDESKDLIIENGRHPVIEQTLQDNSFVPNDAELLHDTSRLILLTGPNMAGKSTYIRQVALIVLMAQIGSFVPADRAHIGVVDRIFCRVGASDDLARGQSTFMVEMSETSLILNNASDRSLVILDEIGRGTATFDGLSIAWAVAEYFHDTLQSRTLFATHYHELTDLSYLRDGIKNYNVAVREWHDDIVFLRKIVPGAADKSYGIQVARLAGMPASIVNRAKTILSHLEMNSSRPTENQTNHVKEKSCDEPRPKKLPHSTTPQMDLFTWAEKKQQIP